MLDIRQVIYGKLNEGLYVDPILRDFKSKVEIYLKKFRRSLSYNQEKTWRDKVVITEKAVNSSRRGFKTRYEPWAPMRSEDHNVEFNPYVKGMFDAARNQELAIENLPDPPQLDDL